MRMSALDALHAFNAVVNGPAEPSHGRLATPARTTGPHVAEPDLYALVKATKAGAKESHVAQLRPDVRTFHDALHAHIVRVRGRLDGNALLANDSLPPPYDADVARHESLELMGEYANLCSKANTRQERDTWLLIHMLCERDLLQDFDARDESRKLDEAVAALPVRSLLPPTQPTTTHNRLCPWPAVGTAPASRSHPDPTMTASPRERLCPGWPHRSSCHRVAVGRTAGGGPREWASRPGGLRKTETPQAARHWHGRYTGKCVCGVCSSSTLNHLCGNPVTGGGLGGTAGGRWV